MNMLAECPSCGASVKVTNQVKMGEIIKCTLCKTDLEVIWLDPLELDLIYEPDEEGSDDFDFEDSDDYGDDDFDYGDEEDDY